MLKTLTKLTLTTSGVAMAIALVGANSTQVQAGLIPYQLQVNIDSGLLAGQSFLGSFKVDYTALTGVGEEFVPVTGLEFDFLGSTYDENDAAPESAAEAFFTDGQFFGLSFTVDEPDFSFTPGFFDVSEAYFSYTLSSGNVGFGDVNYDVVPEPFTLLGASSAIGFGYFFKRKQAKKKSK